MSEQTTPITPAPVLAAPAVSTPPVEAPPQDGEPKTFDADYVRKLRDESAKYRTAAKANEDAAKRLAEIEEANKTEAQKLADRLAAAEAKALAAEVKALRSEIAQAKGVPAGLLTGSTEDELNAAADALLAFKGTAAKLPAAPPASGQGNVGQPVGAVAPQLTRADLQGMSPEAITQAKAEGRLNVLLGIK